MPRADEAAPAPAAAPLGVPGAVAVLTVRWLGRLDLAVAGAAVWRALTLNTAYLAGLLMPYALVGCCFLCFLVWNQWSLVLGHAAFHTPGLHAAQLLYFCCIAGLVTVLPAASTATGRVWLWDTVLDFATFFTFRTRDMGQRAWAVLAARWAVPLSVVATAWWARHDAVVHPFIRSDNRHFTFYACSKLLCKYSWAPRVGTAVAVLVGTVAWARLLHAGQAVTRLHKAIAASALRQAPLPHSALVPSWLRTCAHAGFPGVDRSPATLLADLHRVSWRIAFAAACVCSLAPAGLVEPRYFIVPTVLFLLHARFSRTQLFLLFVAFWAINTATFSLFLHHPFTQPDGSTGRFMW